MLSYVLSLVVMILRLVFVHTQIWDSCNKLQVASFGVRGNPLPSQIWRCRPRYSLRCSSVALADHVLSGDRGDHDGESQSFVQLSRLEGEVLSEVCWVFGGRKNAKKGPGPLSFQKKEATCSILLGGSPRTPGQWYLL